MKKTSCICDMIMIFAVIFSSMYLTNIYYTLLSAIWLVFQPVERCYAEQPALLPGQGDRIGVHLRPRSRMEEALSCLASHCQVDFKHCSLKQRHNKMDTIGYSSYFLSNARWQYCEVQMMSCRNLKSRLTVYQRTHAERSAPRQPMQVLYLFIDDASLSQHRQRQIKDQDNHDGNTGEGLPGSCATCEDEILSSGLSPPCKDCAGAVCQWKPSSSKGGEGCEGRAALDRCNGARHVWLSGPGIEIIIIIATIDMIMTITIVTMIKHSQAREELDTTTSSEVNPRWLKLWLARHPNRWSLVFQFFLSF